jgi:hypothetical protein
VLTLQTHRDLEGYLWSFPRHDHANIGMSAIPCVRSSKLKYYFADLFFTMLRLKRVLIAVFAL